MVGGKERGDKTAEKLFAPASDLSGGAMSKKPNLDIEGRDSVPETMRRTNSLQQATSTASVRPAVSGERVLKQVRILSHVEDLPKSLCSVFARYPATTSMSTPVPPSQLPKSNLVDTQWNGFDGRS